MSTAGTASTTSWKARAGSCASCGARGSTTSCTRWAYVGDSTNDALMFAHFEHSIGVANVRRFEAALPQLPRYVTLQERGAGFAEVAAAVLAVTGC